MRKAIATIVILLAAATAAAAQTPQFMEVYGRALTRFDRNAATDDESLRTSEFSGKMLRSILPDKADDEGNFVNRIDVIRQIKFSGPTISTSTTVCAAPPKRSPTNASRS